MARTATRGPVVKAPSMGETDDVSVAELVADGDHMDARFAEASVAGRDLSRSSFDGCALAGLGADGVRLDDARFTDTRISGLAASSLALGGSVFDSVELTDCRLGAVELYDSTMRSVRFVDCKIEWINLRGARIRDVEFSHCMFGEFDLVDGTAVRMRFGDACSARELDLGGTSLTDVDLRGLDFAGIRNAADLDGTTLSGAQVSALAESFAGHLGIRVEG